MKNINENDLGNKSNQYFQKTNDGKQILRDMMTKYVPSNVTQAVKQGFSSPDASWFKGESIKFVKRTLCEEDARIYEFFDRKATISLLEEHFKGQQNRRLLVWSLINFETYLSLYL